MASISQAGNAQKPNFHYVFALLALSARTECLLPAAATFIAVLGDAFEDAYTSKSQLDSIYCFTRFFHTSFLQLQQCKAEAAEQALQLADCRIQLQVKDKLL
jgi:hypothetical protein